ncbi:aminotransferase class III-fold pyridoxal phosphate-dependent enzyme [Pelagibius sp. Alg239-R121]|uniref:aminotransferase class III-fold pyridoxal phosphate-dependent enzyme n=1 Tax=Pelagibius sp. Alg239-R121 TaxID=2993448 RepID=UPI0024A6F18B|nr:aminotransferase class III-fold pyridoxal phosphate-dependent enzyme [Pelagibius sp. Alg239-R121]
MSSLTTPVPSYSTTQVAEALFLHFGLTGALDPLPSERDQNFRLTGADGMCHIVKIANAGEDLQRLDLQIQILKHLQEVDATLPLPRVLPTRNGETSASIKRHENRDAANALRVVSYLPGTPLAEVEKSPAVLTELGALLGRVDHTLRGFGHPAAHAAFDWDLRTALRSRGRLHFITNDAQRALVSGFLDRFEENVGPHLNRLRSGIIHNDANDWNILVDNEGRISGLIDLGDVTHSIIIAELAIACAYAMLDQASPLEAAADVLRGYHASYPLEEIELDLLFDLIIGRLCTSVTMSASRRDRVTDEPYLAVSERPAWDLLERLDAIDPLIARAIFRTACGYDAVPGASAVTEWIDENRRHLAPVIDPRASMQAKRVLEASNPDLPFTRAMSTTDINLADKIWNEVKDEQAFDLGIGLWGERRVVYTVDMFKSKLCEGDRRDVHLGLDLFAPAGTAIMTPLDAEVVDCRIIPDHQDYGGVVLLKHEPVPGVVFHTLWGHQAHAPVKALKVGQKLVKGDAFIELGAPNENGGWIPHLHLQIVTHPVTDARDVPGAGEARFMDVWRQFYPDPSTLAGLPPETFRRSGRSAEELLEQRRKRLGSNLSVSYKDNPLKIVRGEDVWLIDDQGRAYLDCYNNVAHLGHAHPGVVGALSEQAAKLNTNTRYLQDGLIDYAERLTSTLPDPLSVCYFVCSGSEANDLALRMARAHTRQSDVIVVDWAYHGHLAPLIEVSPYKYKRKGGHGQPEHVHEVPLPETYRAPDDWPSEELGRRYAEPVRSIAQMLACRNKSPAAFIAETIPSVGGQVFLPRDYLSAAYGHAREAGAVCIADEVQVGFGRNGRHMWAFQGHDVVPDIVTMGKPIGNGHPMAALVTTPEIAASFDSGMEYFNTFGGNSVSCAVGLAVLDALEQENLLENARIIGDYLLSGFRQLQQKYDAIGDVRGEGLFFGLDIVSDRTSKAHDSDTAGRVVERMKARGVLAGTDGPYDNVIKMRPAMTFSREHASLLLEVLDQAFGDVVD